MLDTFRGWHYSTPHPGPRYAPSLALDGNGNAHISYYDFNHYLWYRFIDFGGATTDAHTLDSLYRSFNNSSIAVDGDGYVHISYHDDVSDDLKYVYQNSSGWQAPQKLDTTGSVGRYTSLAVAETAPFTAHISYYDDTNDDLKLAHGVGSAWNTQTLDSGGQVGQYTSLATDGGGGVHITYYGSGDLKYFASGRPIETIDSEATAGRDTTLALDESGNAHVSHRGYGGLIYTHRDAAGWHSQTVTLDIHSIAGQDVSLALDGSGIPHISYCDSRDYWTSDLRYAYLDGSNWHVETVDTGNVGTENALAIDGSGYPHIGYYDHVQDYEDPDTSLRYAFQDASGWHTETVESGEAPIGRALSIRLDGDGSAHVSYNDQDHGLKYAYRDASGWHTETVDSRGGTFTSLALDKSGFARISYSYQGVVYAYRDASGWHTETVDSESSRSTSLALDRSGYAHISYYDNDNDDLMYAYQDTSGWHTQTVDSDGDVGWYASIALDSAGRPHIAYYDSTCRDLKYATLAVHEEYRAYLPLTLRSL